MAAETLLEFLLSLSSSRRSSLRVSVVSAEDRHAKSAPVGRVGHPRTTLSAAWRCASLGCKGARANVLQAEIKVIGLAFLESLVAAFPDIRVLTGNGGELQL